MKNKNLYFILVLFVTSTLIFAYQCGGDDDTAPEITNLTSSSNITSLNTSNQSSSNDTTTSISTSTTMTPTTTTTTTTGNTIPFTVQLTNSTSVLIPDNMTGTITSNLVCSTNILISDINFWIRTNHAYFGDLRILLRSPDSTLVQLVNSNTITVDYSTSSYPAHFFDDEGTVSVNSATPDDWRGLLVMIPYQPLSGFDGLSGSGTWSVICWDADIDATGSMLGWGLNITGY